MHAASVSPEPIRLDQVDSYSRHMRVVQLEADRQLALLRIKCIIESSIHLGVCLLEFAIVTVWMRLRSCGSGRLCAADWFSVPVEALFVSRVARLCFYILFCIFYFCVCLFTLSCFFIIYVYSHVLY